MKKDSAGIPQGPVLNHGPGRKPHIWISGIEHKICYHCQVPKPLVAFPGSSRAWDGLGSECRECLSARNARQRAARPFTPPDPTDPIPSRRHIRNWIYRTSKLRSDQ